jgi:hypothetical protein
VQGLYLVPGTQYEVLVFIEVDMVQGTGVCVVT